MFILHSRAVGQQFAFTRQMQAFFLLIRFIASEIDALITLNTRLKTLPSDEHPNGSERVATRGEGPDGQKTSAQAQFEASEAA